MNRYIVDEFHRDPALRQQLFAAARRERNRAVQAGFAWLLARARSLRFPRLSSLRWTERLG